MPSSRRLHGALPQALLIQEGPFIKATSIHKVELRKFQKAGRRYHWGDGFVNERP